MIFLVCTFIISGIVYLIVGTLGYAKSPKNKANCVFLTICIFLMWWAFMSALMVSAPTRQYAAIYRRCTAISWSLIYCCILHFSILIASREYLINRNWKLFLLYLPGIIALIFYAVLPVPADNFVMTHYGWNYVDKHSVNFKSFWYFDIYCLIYVTAIIYNVYKLGISAKTKREKRQFHILGGSMFITAICGCVTDILLPILRVSDVPLLCVVFIIVPILAIYYIIIKYQFMSLTPQNLALEYISIMNEGLVILDEKNVIQYINSGAANLLLYNEDDLNGVNISKILLNSEGFGEISKQCGIKYNLIDKNNRVIPVILSYSVLLDNFNDKYGTVIIFQDISEFEKTHCELEQKIAELQQANENLNTEIKMRKKAEQKVA